MTAYMFHREAIPAIAFERAWIMGRRGFSARGAPVRQSRSTRTSLIGFLFATCVMDWVDDQGLHHASGVWFVQSLDDGETGV